MIKNLRPTLAEGGKIKIGGLGDERQKDGGGTYRLPVKHDSFTITTSQRTRKGDLEPNHEIMGALATQGYADPDGKIRRLPVILHSDNVDEVFPTRYARYQGSTLQCSGDGEEATTADGEVIDCPCPHLEARRCKPNGTLLCSIALPGYAVAGAVHRWRTTSIISIQQMIGSLQHIRQTVGAIQGIPLTLRVGPITVTPEGKATTVYVCWLELRARDLAEVQQQALHLAQQRQAVQSAIAAPVAPYRELVAASREDEDRNPDPDLVGGTVVDVEPEPETEPAPAPAPEATETARETVFRIGKAKGLSGQKIAAVVRKCQADEKVPENSNTWTDKHVSLILEEMP